VLLFASNRVGAGMYACGITNLVQVVFDTPAPAKVCHSEENPQREAHEESNKTFAGDGVLHRRRNV